MKIKGKRDSNELQIKITWVLDSDSSDTEFQFSIYFHGPCAYWQFKKYTYMIIAYTQFFTVSCITMEFIYTYSFYGTLLVCVKARESKICM